MVMPLNEERTLHIQNHTAKIKNVCYLCHYLTKQAGDKYYKCHIKVSCPAYPVDDGQPYNLKVDITRSGRRI